VATSLSPAEARERARKILEQQKAVKRIRVGRDGEVIEHDSRIPGSSVLVDKDGEY
jgi:hypothetical protein